MSTLHSFTLTVVLLDLKVSVVEVDGGDVWVLGVDDGADAHGSERQFTWGRGKYTHEKSQ